MYIDPLIPFIAGVVAIVLALAAVLKLFRQPHFVGYILAGLLIGPSGLGVISDVSLIEHLGAIGVTLLMFFIGLEVSPHKFVRGWRIAVIGTLLQIGVSIACAWSIGAWLGWPVGRIVLLGFVISLSSTAVVLKLLHDRGELDSKAAENVILILIAQDLAVVPMMIVVSLLSGNTLDTGQLMRQLIGGTVIIGATVFVLTRRYIRLPFADKLRDDHELQILGALLVCFGFAFVSSSLGLSSALGAFLAGMIVASARETDWARRTLEPLRVIFVGLLFLSMGMQIHLDFISTAWVEIVLLVIGVLLTNTFINAVVLRLLGDTWRISLYSGALLAQIGEFSFVLAAVGLQVGLIQGYSYQMTIAVIALSLLLSPAWISASRRLLIDGAGRQVHTEKNP